MMKRTGAATTTRWSRCWCVGTKLARYHAASPAGARRALRDPRAVLRRGLRLLSPSLPDAVPILPLGPRRCTLRRRASAAAPPTRSVANRSRASRGRWLATESSPWRRAGATRGARAVASRRRPSLQSSTRPRRLRAWTRCEGRRPASSSRRWKTTCTRTWTRRRTRKSSGGGAKRRRRRPPPSRRRRPSEEPEAEASLDPLSAQLLVFARRRQAAAARGMPPPPETELEPEAEPEPEAESNRKKPRFGPSRTHSAPPPRGRCRASAVRAHLVTPSSIRCSARSSRIRWEEPPPTTRGSAPPFRTGAATRPFMPNYRPSGGSGGGETDLSRAPPGPSGSSCVPPPRRVQAAAAR